MFEIRRFVPAILCFAAWAVIMPPALAAATHNPEPIINVDLAQVQAGATLNRPLPAMGATLELWIRGDYTGETSTPIIESMARATEQPAGWQIVGDITGAWKFTMKRGDSELAYLPTAHRQGVFDDHWHQVAFVHVPDRRELRLFFDGVNVAIYAINGFEQCFGGPIHRLAESFQGVLGTMRVWDVPLNDDDIAALWHTHMRTLDATYEKPAAPDHPPVRELTIMAWNIWHGGRENGSAIGPSQVIDVIREADPDIICMQETYGSGPRIADALGYHLYLRSSNLSIMSRLPIGETHDLYQPFRLGGARITLDQYRSVHIFSLWIHYQPDYWLEPIPTTTTAQDLIDAEAGTRVQEIGDIIDALQPLAAMSQETPLIVAGDYNSSSHLDWTDRTKQMHSGLVVRWPVSSMMADAGFVDGYRSVHTDPLTHPGRTWSPRFPEQLQDRIDYVYTQGTALKPIEAKMIDTHPVHFPSDHAAVVVTYRVIAPE